MPASESSSSHPRPQLNRGHWTSLDGPWEFGIGDDVAAITRTITVPFAPETPASGIEVKGYFDRCWYRRTIDVPSLKNDQRFFLHYEAADYETHVWVSGQFVGTHEGGYSRFSFDITDAVRGKTSVEIMVRCDEDPHDLAKPRGKQDWLPEPHAIWYPRTSGIWQTVWTEIVPTAHIASVRWTADVTKWTLRLDTQIAGESAGMRLQVQTRVGSRVLSDDTFQLERGAVSRSIHLPDGGIDSVRDELLWTPSRPTLIDATLTLLTGDGRVIDRVETYTAMRSVATDGDRFMLNGRPIELRLLLDQGYWPDTGLTPPDDDAIIKDIELVKSMGFNGVRKHQKIEAERFLYFADKIGLLVWEEMPSPYTFTPESVHRTTTQWMAAIERDISHPCIIAWVPLNESWGVPDLPLRTDQLSFAKALYHLTKSLDPTRPVISNDGWEMTETDLINVHDYDHDPQRLQDRYNARLTPTATMLTTARPGGRVIVLDESVYRGQPMLLTEFGGIALSSDANATWGYSRATNGDDLAKRYAKLLSAVRAVPAFSGFCYTQFTDTYQEANGLVTMDRQPKVDPRLITIATRGPANPHEQQDLARLISE